MKKVICLMLTAACLLLCCCGSSTGQEASVNEAEKAEEAVDEAALLAALTEAEETLKKHYGEDCDAAYAALEELAAQGYEPAKTALEKISVLSDVILGKELKEYNIEGEFMQSQRFGYSYDAEGKVLRETVEEAIGSDIVNQYFNGEVSAFSADWTLGAANSVMKEYCMAHYGDIEGQRFEENPEAVAYYKAVLEENKAVLDLSDSDTFLYAETEYDTELPAELAGLAELGDVVAVAEKNAALLVLGENGAVKYFVNWPAADMLQTFDIYGYRYDEAGRLVSAELKRGTQSLGMELIRDDEGKLLRISGTSSINFFGGMDSWFTALSGGNLHAADSFEGVFEYDAEGKLSGCVVTCSKGCRAELGYSTGNYYYFDSLE